LDAILFEEGIEPLPALEGQLAAWLAPMVLSDKTSSPNDDRCATISYFNKIAGGAMSEDMTIVQMTKESILRKLGYRNQSKKPLLQDEDMTLGDFIVTNDFVFDSLEFWLPSVSHASFEVFRRTQSRANCSVAWYVSWRTRFVDRKRV
jgi:hypothetical protein